MCPNPQKVRYAQASGEGVSSIGPNSGAGSCGGATSTRSRSSTRRQRYTSDVQIRCRPAISDTLAPGIIASDTIRALSSSLNRRRGSPSPAPEPSIIHVAIVPHQCLPQCRTFGLRLISLARRGRPNASLSEQIKNECVFGSSFQNANNFGDAAKNALGSGLLWLPPVMQEVSEPMER